MREKQNLVNCQFFKLKRYERNSKNNTTQNKTKTVSLFVIRAALHESIVVQKTLKNKNKRAKI